MSGDEPTKVIPAASPRRRLRKFALAGVAIAVAAATAVGGFFVGQNTRKSDSEVATLSANAVAAETNRQEDIRRKALDERKAKDKATLRRVVKKLKKAAQEQAQQSYASGQSLGYSAGEEKGEKEGYEAGSLDGYLDGSLDGYESGLEEGSDSLDCSDDPDAYWLPPCY